MYSRRVSEVARCRSRLYTLRRDGRVKKYNNIVVCIVTMYFVVYIVFRSHFVPNLTFGAPLVKCLRKKIPDAFFGESHLYPYVCEMMSSMMSVYYNFLMVDFA